MSSYLLVIDGNSNRIAHLFKDLSENQREDLHRVLLKKYPRGSGFYESFFITDNPWNYLGKYSNGREFMEELKSCSTAKKLALFKKHALSGKG